MQWDKPVFGHNTAPEEEANVHNVEPPVGEDFFMRQYRVAQLLDNFKGTYEEWLVSRGF